MTHASHSPFSEHSAAHQVAESLGFELVRCYRTVEVLDEPALIAAGYLAKPKLDIWKIGRDLEAGLQVEGARLKGYEYVLAVRP
jgi:hypothetical protein